MTCVNTPTSWLSAGSPRCLSGAEIKARGECQESRELLHVPENCQFLNYD